VLFAAILVRTMARGRRALQESDNNLEPGTGAPGGANAQAGRLCHFLPWRLRLEAYEFYLLCALFWFVVQTMYTAVHFTALALAPTEESLLARISVWQAPLRDLQIHGFALLMILGVSHRILDKLYHLPQPSARRSLVVLALLNLAVLAEAGGFVAMRTWGHQYVGLWYGGVILLFGAVAALVWSWRLDRPVWRPDRSIKFIRAAYGWLLLSLAMLVLLPAYQFGLLRVFAPDSQAAAIGFSHAYYGAIRHAATVGFISMMILGVAAKFVPVFTGVDGRTLTNLWAPFVLLNTGCAMRVVFQTLTDFTPAAFPVAGVSGLLEVTALAIWGAHLAGLMLQRGHARRAQTGAGSAGFHGAAAA
jgi:hypothetical protein